MTSNVDDLPKLIVNYRVMCDSDLAERDCGAITQEEYADSIDRRLKSVLDKINTIINQEVNKVLGELMVEAVTQVERIESGGEYIEHTGVPLEAIKKRMR